ncbi:nuclear transport factor 2 family protein [Kibdelosporangium philippinense]|uniref:Nuclear transport factor 2 family protein n=1 Tax=Kibdelosporangium philippinense TaxID=211113 RepID=A0ABS8ZU87_9PSEU|nr:nuclear transport factor 2 family protein [Kibdelosporangium philippinense]MCE7011167.1 nuclear transport factor 2 family protein [Kibdelosporangium philippinense]
MATPAEVVTKLIHEFATTDFSRIPDLYAEDSVTEVRFFLPSPNRLEGSEGIRRSTTTQMDQANLVNVEVHDLIIHETGPTEVVAEWEYRGFSLATGEAYSIYNAIITNVVDGKITTSRDYHNTVAVLRNAGRLNELLETLAKPATWDERVNQ